MIYDHPAVSEDIRQGDIFRSVPRVDFQLSKLPVIVEDEDDPREVSWSALLAAGGDDPVMAVLGIRPVTAIVITQDCDAVRSTDIALAEVRVFRIVEPKCKETGKPSKWADIITQHARINQKWFYLPTDDDMEFSEKMAVDFRSVLRVGRTDLEQMRDPLRLGRLNETALAHFRERVGEFFRRYPYNEWYPLNHDEFSAYSAGKSEPIEAYPWQT